MCSGSPERSCRTRFTQPPEVLSGTPVISCPLVRLPTEVLLRIFQEADPIDAVCLALASKRLVQVSAMLKIRVPSVAKHRYTLPSSCDEIYQLIRRFQPQVDRYKWAGGERKFGLCTDCLQYRLRASKHWKPLAGKYHRTRGVSAKGWAAAVERWRRDLRTQCPECYCKDHYAERPEREKHAMHLRSRSTVSG
ncbi:uncharacterized protein G6M90_00g055190 [Metarhizium brunneum]|uniref:F-box domain-containing protein n=1 Tax=Metarhizium brunneum TaxID=500148 RepID=A0A7D5UXQ1_9HYPO|nr:hypothetical protein G6M90_00g055190 [Metarhizium brunneum]